MTEDAAGLSRFIVREGAVKNTWMVWDREERGHAIIQGRRAIGLSEPQAHELREKLTRDHGGQ